MSQCPPASKHVNNDFKIKLCKYEEGNALKASVMLQYDKTVYLGETLKVTTNFIYKVAPQAAKILWKHTYWMCCLPHLLFHTNFKQHCDGNVNIIKIFQITLY